MTEGLYELFVQVLRQIATDLVAIFPKVIIGIVALAALILTARILNRVVSRFLKLIQLDDMFQALTKTRLPFSLGSVIIALLDLGILLVGLFGLANLFLGAQYVQLLLNVFGYGARIISVIVILILVFVVFNLLIDRMMIETTMKGYVVFLMLVLTTMLVVDLTNLSPFTKQAVQGGLSIGLGISVGIFAAWFFFHDMCEKFLALRSAPKERHDKLE